MKSPDEATATATLIFARGEAIELMAWAKRKIGDRATAQIEKTEKLVAQLQTYIDNSDFVKATPIVSRLQAASFRLRELEAGPFAVKGRKRESDFRTGRDAANRDRQQAARLEWDRWNACARPHWSPGITKNAVARIVQSKLGLDKNQVPNIARRLKKPRQAT
jgi:hypothetical protein